jgi:hypothetical protein
MAPSDRCRAAASRSAPDSRLSRSSRRPSNCSSPSESTRAAASSRASGKPSSRRTSRDTSGSVRSSRTKPGSACRARSGEQDLRLRCTRRVARLRHGQRAQPVPGLTRQPERLPAGGQHLHIVGARQQGQAQLGGGLDHVLAVVQHDEQLAAGQRRGQHGSVRHPRPRRYLQGSRHRRRYPVRIGDRGQLDQPHPVREPGGDLSADLSGQPGLPDASRPEHGDQTVRAQQAGHFAHRFRPAHEAAQGAGKAVQARRPTG